MSNHVILSKLSLAPWPEQAASQDFMMIQDGQRSKYKDQNTNQPTKKCNVVSPTRSLSPLSSTRGCRGARRTESLITVPFTEPRSSTRNVSPSSQIRACRRETFVSGSNLERSISGKIFECGSVRPSRLLSFCKMNDASSSVVPVTTSFAVGLTVCSSALEPTPSGCRAPQCAQNTSSAAMRPPQKPQ